MLFLPQTPQFLMIQKKDAQAEVILRKLKLTTNVRQTMADIRLTLAEEEAAKRALCVADNNMRGRRFIGFGLVIAQQITGQPNIIYYASDVFKAVGFCTNWSSTLATVGLGTMKVISTAVSLSLVDRVGRKKCLTVGIAIMGWAVMTLGIFAIVDGSEATRATCDDELLTNTTSNVPLEMKE